MVLHLHDGVNYVCQLDLVVSVSAARASIFIQVFFSSRDDFFLLRAYIDSGELCFLLQNVVQTRQPQHKLASTRSEM